jgi:hypothetical protein
LKFNTVDTSVITLFDESKGQQGFAGGQQLFWFNHSTSSYFLLLH